MAVLRNKGMMLIGIFMLLASIGPTWAKTLYSGIFNDCGYLAFGQTYINAILFYSPVFIVMDAIFSVLIILYLKKLTSKNIDR